MCHSLNGLLAIALAVLNQAILHFLRGKSVKKLHDLGVLPKSYPCLLSALAWRKKFASNRRAHRRIAVGFEEVAITKLEFQRFFLQKEGSGQGP